MNLCLKLILPLVVLSLSYFQGVAETVSRKEASHLAEMFFNQVYGKVMGKPELVYNGKKHTTDRLFSPFYVFNCPAGGFVIVSAENKTFPVLGFSLKERFNPNSLGDKGKALLTQYAKDIESIRYDSRIPDEAIKAWNDIPGYISGILTAHYNATDPVFTMEEASERVTNIINAEMEDELSSDIFTPSQWQDLINEELMNSNSVAVGLVTQAKVLPIIIHGRQGDYYRIELDGTNNWLMRLMATEFLSDGQIADLDRSIEEKTDNLPEDIPFSFYEEFIAAVTNEREQSAEMFEKRITPTEPEVNHIGGGHFQIRFPEDIYIGRIYNLQGALVEQLTFRDTDTVVLKLDKEPSGFYMAQIIGESGRPYSFKLYK